MNRRIKFAKLILSYQTGDNPQTIEWWQGYIDGASAACTGAIPDFFPSHAYAGGYRAGYLNINEDKK